MRKVFIIPVLMVLLTAGCKKRIDNQVERNSLEVPVAEVLERGLGYLADGKFYTARRYFEMIQDNAANSMEFPQAKIGLADAYFYDISTGAPDALPEYQSYLVYFPNGEYAAYAQYMVGMCYYSEVNSPDRDQSYSRKAISEFEKLKTQFPDSPYVTLCDEKIRLCWQRMAQHEYEVGVFYHKVNSHRAAEMRFRYVLDNYLSYLTVDEREDVYYFFSRTLFALTKYDEAARYFRLLLEQYPDNLNRDQLRADLADIESGKLQREKEERIEEIREEFKKRRDKDTSGSEQDNQS